MILMWPEYLVKMKGESDSEKCNFIYFSEVTPQIHLHEESQINDFGMLYKEIWCTCIQ